MGNYYINLNSCNVHKVHILYILSNTLFQAIISKHILTSEPAYESFN